MAREKSEQLSSSLNANADAIGLASLVTPLAAPPVAAQDNNGPVLMAGASVPVVTMGTTSIQVNGFNMKDGTFTADFGVDGPASSGRFELTFNKPGMGFLVVSADVGELIEITFQDASGDFISYGTLTLSQATGAGAGPNDYVFQFTGTGTAAGDLEVEIAAKDADGDIGRPATPLTVEVLSGEISLSQSHLEAGKDVEEKNLPGGTDPSEGGLRTVIDLKGLPLILDSAWKLVTDPELLGKGFTHELASTDVLDSANIQINGFGRLLYKTTDPGKLTYELQSPVHNGLNSDQAQDTLVIKVRSPQGEAVPVDVVIDVVDDKPTMSFSPATHKVSSGDTYGDDAGESSLWSHHYGADQAGKIELSVTNANGVTAKISTQVGVGAKLIVDGKEYGTLLLKANGTYEFTAKPNITETITIGATIYDSDGDFVAASGTLTFEIKKPDGPITIGDGDNEMPSESNLPKGTDPDPAALTKEFELPPGYILDTTGWTPDNGSFRLDGNNGFMLYEPDPTTPKLTYTLTDEGKHPLPGTDTISDDFDITLVDAKGNTYELKTEVQIEDDMPAVALPTATPPAIMSTGDTEDLGCKINFGADGPGVDPSITVTVSNGAKTGTFDITPGAPVDLKVNGESWGTLTVDPVTGEFEFTAAPNIEHTLTFTLTATDGDGDPTSASTSITTEKPVPPPAVVLDAAHGPSEANLSKTGANDYEGTAPNAALLSKLVDLPANCTLDITGWTLKAGTVYSLAGQNGHLEYNTATNKLSFILDKATDQHTLADKSGADDVYAENFQITVKDALGNTYAQTAKMAIQDDAPVLTIAAPADPVESGFTAEGTWTHKFGADGPAAQDALSVKFTVGAEEKVFSVTLGQAINLVLDNGENYGTITFQADGTYDLKAAANFQGTLGFAVGATDGDGDFRESNGGTPFEITIIPPPPPADLIPVTVSEANLGTGTHADPAALVKPINLAAGVTVDVSDPAKWSTADGVLYKLIQPAGAPGSLEYNATTHKLEYILTKESDHPLADKSGAADVLESTLNLVIKDAGNNTWSKTLTVTIEDDAPLVSLTAPRAEVGTGQRLTFDASGTKFGADGDGGMSMNVALGSKSVDITLVPGTPQDITIDGVYCGKLQLDGTTHKITFLAAPNAEHELGFVLTATDGDGDSATSGAPVIIKTTPPPPPTDPLGEGEWVAEASLTDQYNPTSGTEANLADTIKPITIPTGYKIDTTGWADVNGKYQLQGSNGYFEYDAAANALTYTLQTAAQHADPTKSGADDVFVENFNGGQVTLVDSYGNTFKVPVEIAIHDDKSLLHQGGSGDVAYSGEDFWGDWGYNPGADGIQNPANPQAVLEVTNLDSAAKATLTLPLLTPTDVIIDGTLYGTFTLFYDAKYLFQPAANIAANGDVRLNLALGVYDGDGDYTLANNHNPAFPKIGHDVTIKHPEGPDLPNFGTMVFEAGLADGTRPAGGENVQYISLPQGYTIDVSVGGWGYFENEPGELYLKKATYGYIFYSAAYNEMTYLLTENATHPGVNKADGNDLLADLVDITFKDAAGNTWVRTATIQIGDDAPIGDFGGPAGPAESGHLYEGSWAVLFGADGPAATKAYSLAVTEVGGASRTVNFTLPLDVAVDLDFGNGLSYGKLTLHSATGKYSFVPASDLDDVKLSLVLNATDGDGDTTAVNAPFEIAIEKPEPTIDEITVSGNLNEANLPDGTSPNGAELTKPIAIPAGYSLVLDGGDWTENAGVYTKDAGITGGFLTYDTTAPGGPTLTYTMDDNFAHSGAGRDSLAGAPLGTVTLKDSFGNTYVIDVEGTVVDDMPVLGNPPDAELDHFNSFAANGSGDVDFGADGPQVVGSAYALRVDFAHAAKDGTPRGQGGAEYQLPTNGDPITVQTSMGKLIVKWDAATQTVKYDFAGTYGFKDDTEEITFTLRDSEGDAGTSSFTITPKENIPGAIFNVDEAGLSFGSHHAGYGDTSQTHTLDAKYMNPAATSIEWNVTAIADIYADGDRDGQYQKVTWLQVGNSLRGFADGEMVMEVRPDFTGGVFSGKFTTTMHSAFKHGDPATSPVTDSELYLNLEFTQVGGTDTPASVSVVIKDDMPLSSGSDKVIIEVNESGQRLEDVYLVLDTSGSMGVTATNYNQSWFKQVEAVRQLAQAYVDNNITSRFTVIVFKEGAAVVDSLAGVTPHALLEILKPDSSAYTLLHANPNVMGDTGYTKALELLMAEIDKSMTRNTSKGMEKAVYFVTDGAQNAQVDEYWDTWTPYLDAHRDNIKTFALGVNFDYTAERWDSLVHITGDPSRVFEVQDFDHLAEQLVALIPDVTGDLLAAIASADLTTVTAATITLNNGASESFALDQWDADKGMMSTGPIELAAGGVKLIIYENGEYKLTSANIEETLTATIQLTLRDADGDVSQSPAIDLRVMDSKPIAFDNVQYADEYIKMHMLGDFEPAPGTPNNADGWAYHQVISRAAPPNANFLPRPDWTNVDGVNVQQLITDTYGETLDHSENGWISIAPRAASVGVIESFTGTTDFVNLLQSVGMSDPFMRDANTYNVNLMSKSFSSSGGDVYFSWMFTGFSGAAEKDGAFWILLDENNNRIDSGQIMALDYKAGGSTPETASGVTKISIPVTGNTQYKLVFGVTECGSANSPTTVLDTDNDGKADTSFSTKLYLNEVVLLDSPYTFGGNVMYDPSPEGQFDMIYDVTKVYYVEYAGQRYDFSANENSMTISTPTGELHIDRDGDYTFVPKPGATFTGEKFTYVLIDADKDTSNTATLFLHGGTAPQTLTAYDNLATPVGYGSSLLGDFGSSDPAQYGWTKFSAQSLTSGVVLPQGMTAPVTDYRLEPFTDGYNLQITGSQAHTSAQLNTLFGGATNEAVATALFGMGIDAKCAGNTAGYPLYGVSMTGAVSSTVISAKGGQVVFDWVFGGDQEGNKAEGDAAFYVLKDSKGNTVMSGELAQLVNSGPATALVSAAGTTSIILPDTVLPENYTLYVGYAQLGAALGNTPSLYINTVAHQDSNFKFAGNVVRDSDADKQIDVITESTVLHSVAYGAQVKEFGTGDTVEFSTPEGGTLVVYKNGNYEFSTNTDDLAIIRTVCEDFTYTLTDADGRQSSAELHVRGSDLQLYLSSADDVKDFSGRTTSDYIEAGAGNDVIKGGDHGNIIYGGLGNDTLHAGNGGDSLHGGMGNDSLIGGAGADKIYGGDGNDFIDGKGGNDLIYGGTGNNSLNGGAGADTFAWNLASIRSGSDKIMDFSAIEGDKLGFKDLLEPQQTMDLYFKDHVDQISLDKTDNTIDFRIHDGLFEHTVELHFNPATDTTYNNFVSAYDQASGAAQQEVLVNFLLSLSS